MATSEFPLPDVGEGLTEAEIVAWKVKPGDTVAVNQVIVEIETAKSLVELPSPFAGTVVELLADEGQTVEVGKVIVRVASEGADAGPAGSGDARDSEAALVEDTAATVTPAEPANLVGYGAAGHGSSRRRKGGAAGAGAPAAGAASAGESARPAQAAQSASNAAAASTTSVSEATTPAPVPAASAVSAPSPASPVMPSPVSAGSAPTPGSAPTATRAHHGIRRVGPLPVVTAGVLAKPPIRKLAKDLDVDLSAVEGTGLLGEITREDVIRHAEQASVFRNIETPEWPDDREERIPVKGVRKAIATSMVQSAFSAPHVGLFVDVDATRTMEFVKRLKSSPDFAGIKVSPMLIMAKAMIWAVRRNPTVNSTWTDDEIIVHHYVNFGFAAATPRGLVVPNIKDAQALSLKELAVALEHMTNTAREGRLQPADMAGGTITVTNIGVFGMDTGTPILNPGEVGIVALGTIKQKPWVVDGEVRPRFVTTLGASFDHRVVDGDVASRFLADVASVIEEPALLLD
ncbi:dihydrolipoamide acetyltransferase family protein [Ruicaihuangia caeni]|uniref:Dihydrolipoamide acetyltransferase component of pyruvate dehydrogenase complex n=1 Tax=Ruicaihuangia caeni TaxID=3042517 RepID=A0AAW6TBT0_9MICO|nr:dihydrolipoamide acetyltransferase family protein [Klugiella sp. YN-L-19]MDI2099072.1 dihydrolipoamide acetyltransferase family protein [Klugiella sp. YN-L-19]